MNTLMVSATAALAFSGLSLFTPPALASEPCGPSTEQCQSVPKAEVPAASITTGDQPLGPEHDCAGRSPSVYAVNGVTTVADIKESGIQIHASCFTPGTWVYDSTSADPVATVDAEHGFAAWAFNVDALGEVKPGTDLEFWAEGVPFISTTGEPERFPVVVKVLADNREEPSMSPNATPTATPNEAPSAPGAESATTTPQPRETQFRAAASAFTFAPTTITTADFVNEDHGVQLSAKNLAPKQDLFIRVTAQSGDSAMLEQKTTADVFGDWAFTVYGVNDTNPAAYIGEYTVEISSQGASLFNGSFEVVADTTRPGAGTNSPTRGLNSLPRTGAHIGGILGGATLLIAGAATVLLSHRKHEST